MHGTKKRRIQLVEFLKLYAGQKEIVHGFKMNMRVRNYRELIVHIQVKGTSWFNNYKFGEAKTSSGFYSPRPIRYQEV